MNYQHGVCTFCGTGCGHFLKVDGDRIEGVFPSQGHPVSKGRLCVRGWNIHELLSSYERITTPLIKKNGSFTQASYEEAIDCLVSRLGSYPSASLSPIGFLASPRSSNEEAYLLMRLARAVFRSSNISLALAAGHRSSLDILHAGTGLAGMTGSLEQISSADLIMVVGFDITRRNPIIASEIHKAGLAGAQIITVDRLRTQMARLSNVFLHVCPGTIKLALAGLAKIIIERDLVDADFVASHTEQFETFAGFLKGLRLDYLEQGAGIGRDELARVAAALANAEAAMAFFPSGISGLHEDTITLLYNLMLMTGHVGREACGINPVTGLNNLQGVYDMGMAPDLLTGFQPLADQQVIGRFNSTWNTSLSPEPGLQLPSLLMHYPGALKGLVVIDYDEQIIPYVEYLKKLDCIAYVGSFKNSFMQHADIVLPVATYVEQDGTFTNTERRVQLSPRKINPLPGVLPAWQLCMQIASRAGQNWPYASPSAVMDEIARLTPAYAGISHAKLGAGFGIQWPCDEHNPEGTPFLDITTQTRKLRFVPIRTDLPVPVASVDFPFILIIGKEPHFWHQNNLIHKTYIPHREANATLLDFPEGYVELSPQTAGMLQVRPGRQVRVVSQQGQMTVSVKISDDLLPGVAYAPYFVRDMIADFLMGHYEILQQGSEAFIPVQIEKVA
jgi:formate dehydrogenase major subunit